MIDPYEIALARAESTTAVIAIRALARKLVEDSRTCDPAWCSAHAAHVIRPRRIQRRKIQPR